MVNTGNSIPNELQELKNEYSEFKAQSKEYEDELENELFYKDAQINSINSENSDLKKELLKVKSKLKQNEADISRLLLDNETKTKKLNEFSTHKRQLEQINDHWENSARVLEFSRQVLEEKLNEAEENAIFYKEELEEISQQKEIELQRLKEQFNELKQELLITSKRKIDFNKQFAIETIEDIKINLSGNERTYLRKGSLEMPEEGNKLKIFVRFNAKYNEIHTDLELSSKCIKVKSGKGKEKVFEFNKVFCTDYTVSEFFVELNETHKALFSSRSMCFFSYGPSNSEKSASFFIFMERSLHYISALLPQYTQIELTITQIHNDQLKDLLIEYQSSKLHFYKDKLIIPWSLNWMEDVQNALNYVREFCLNHNPDYFSSHIITTLGFPSINSKLQFVDLASSEKIHSKSVKSFKLKEFLMVNKSLSCLESVLSAIANKQKHIPFRNSMLTKYLQSTLSSSCEINLILNCNSSNENLKETIATLSVGSRLQYRECSMVKTLKSSELERCFKLLESERKEKQKLLILLDKLQRDLEAYKMLVTLTQIKPAEDLENPRPFIKRLPPAGKLMQSPLKQNNSACASAFSSPRSKVSRIPVLKLSNIIN